MTDVLINAIVELNNYGKLKCKDLSVEQEKKVIELAQALLDRKMTLEEAEEELAKFIKDEKG
jgi:hypothetical protein